MVKVIPPVIKVIWLLQLRFYIRALQFVSLIVWWFYYITSGTTKQAPKPSPIITEINAHVMHVFPYN